MSVPCIHSSKIISDDEIEKREGEYFNQKHYHTIITKDSDVLKEDGTILFKYRKNVLSKSLSKIVVDNLRELSMTKHNNRGAPAGLLDRKKMNNYVGDWYKTFKFRTHYYSKRTNKKSKHDISNLAPSNLVGYFDRKDRNDPQGLPCRLTSFSAKETEKWTNIIPFIKEISKQFQLLMPNAFNCQLSRALESKDYIIEDTCFSTITVNYSWRTGMHKDKGDFKDGFGNLIVCEDLENPNKYIGCYLGFPQYGICVDVRNGDFLAMDVHEWHCNTEFIKTDTDKIPFAKFKEIDFNNDWYFNRLSLVCYLRNNMYKCKNRNLKKNKELSENKLKQNN